MSFTQRAHARATDRSARNPWSTEPELPPDPLSAGAEYEFDVRTALIELDVDARNLITEISQELETLRPLLVVDASAATQYASALRRLAAAEQTALDVHAALTRLNEGTYGFCVSCTKPIPAARLEHRPHTRCCVPCS